MEHQPHHDITSPIYPQSNGLIEIQVRTIKGIIQKCAKTGNDTLIALQQHRCISLDSNLSSPSEIVFNRPIRTTESSPDADAAEPATDQRATTAAQRPHVTVTDVPVPSSPRVAWWTTREDPQQRDSTVEPGRNRD